MTSTTPRAVDDGNDLDRLLALLEGGPVRLVGDDGTSVTLPEEAVTLLEKLAAWNRRQVTHAFLPRQGDITFEEAADALDMSEELLAALTLEGEIPRARPTSPTMFSALDVMKFRAKRDTSREMILAHMTREGVIMGGYGEDAATIAHEAIAELRALDPRP